MHAVRVLTGLLICTSLSFGAEPVKLRTLAGKTIEGELVSISDKVVVLKPNEKQVVPIPVAQVLDIDLHASPVVLATKYIDVQLTDGSLLHCTQFGLKGQQAVLKLAAGREVKLPLTAISYVLNDAQDARVRAQWQGLLTKRGNSDLLAIKDSAGKVNTLPGTFGAGDEKGESIEFETDNGQKLRLKLGRLHGMSFLRKPDPNSPPTLCKVYDTLHNILLASKLSLGEKTCAIRTISGVQIEYPRQLVARLDYSKGKLTYLSDLEPVRVIEKSLAERIEHYRRDLSLDGGPLWLREQKYDKGLALHAYTELIYDIGGQYKEFTAMLGVDSRVGGDSHVKVTIYGDGKELFSADVKRKDDPRPVRLDVKNVKELRIVVASARPLDLDLGDHVDLADAKVSK